MKTLNLPAQPLVGECRVIYSGRRFGGFYVSVQYLTETDAALVGVQVVVPQNAVAWTVPVAEWDGLWRVAELPVAWRSIEARPPFPEVEPLADAFQKSVTERTTWWAKEQQISLTSIRLTLTSVRVHPTDTSPGICEQAGREIIDDLVGQLRG